MDFASLTSSDIPTVARGFAAARDGLPYDEHETELWKAAYRLHPSFAGPIVEQNVVVTFTANPKGSSQQ